MELPGGEYPFIDERLPLSEMAMVEAPSDLEALFMDQAARNGITLLRDQPVELRCRSKEYPDNLVAERLGPDTHACAEKIRVGARLMSVW